MEEYKRPELSNDEMGKMGAWAVVLAGLPLPKRVQMIYKICEENLRLVKELNSHREARGYEPLPIYDTIPQQGKNGKR